MKKLLKWIKQNRLMYFTLIGINLYYNGVIIEILSFDFAQSEKERALFRFQFDSSGLIVIHLLFIEFEINNKYKV